MSVPINAIIGTSIWAQKAPVSGIHLDKSRAGPAGRLHLDLTRSMATPRRTLDRITLTHLLRAARAIGADGAGYPPFRRSITYDALLPGDRTPYPPKALIARAYELATGERLTPSDFAGARKGFYIRRLEDLGCEIRNKPVNRKPAARRGASEPRKADQVSTAMAADVAALLARAGVPTEIQRVVLARIGQGEFRRKLERHWGSACALTGLIEPAALRASHIKRWADSDDHERLDVDNGLLLRADIDALFEVGLIQFRDDGRIDLTRLSVQTAMALGLHGQMRLRRKPNAAQRAFLALHRARCAEQGDARRARHR
ncbi:HNH endonuclease signature motif containing protein [Burkholderiaceae bacterium 26]|uniref:HNH endonuclease n=1 Tax=Ralstonia holmesii TaxID=3058602 RepID=UPI0009E4F467